MRIRLSDDRRAALLRAIKQHFAAEFDEPISDFRASELLGFFVRELGPPVYNQRGSASLGSVVCPPPAGGVRDACGYVQDKLGDIEGEIHEPEPR
jgi:uncharacterized protein (DUF2164 family)